VGHQFISQTIQQLAYEHISVNTSATVDTANNWDPDYYWRCIRCWKKDQKGAERQNASVVYSTLQGMFLAKCYISIRNVSLQDATLRPW